MNNEDRYPKCVVMIWFKGWGPNQFTFQTPMSKQECEQSYKNALNGTTEAEKIWRLKDITQNTPIQGSDNLILREEHKLIPVDNINHMILAEVEVSLISMTSKDIERPKMILDRKIQ